MSQSSSKSILLSAALLAGILVPSTASYADDVTLSLSDFWVRAMPPSQKMTAGYGTVTNTGAKPVIVTGAHSNVAANTQMHETVQVDDSVRMVAMEARELAPGESLQFVPGGAHLMLMGIEQMPAADSVVTVCIEMSDETTACIDAPVLRSAPIGNTMSNHDHHSMHH